MKLLTQEEINAQLSEILKGWSFEQNSIKKEFRFGNFIKAFSFMTAVALEAEKMDHHPDWSNSYGLVSISLTTHSEGGVTMNDISLATKIETIVKNVETKHLKF